MKLILFAALLTLSFVTLESCRLTRHTIHKAIKSKPSRPIKISRNQKDSVVVTPNHPSSDSLLMISRSLSSLRQHYIDFKTFTGKIKVSYQDSKGKKPDLTAKVNIVRDSAIWISLTASFINIEVFRMLVTRDSIILMDKQKKEYQARSIDYLQDVTDIPFDYKTLQDLLVGNPIFLDSNIVSYKKTESNILISTLGRFFKNLLTLTLEDGRLVHSKLDDMDLSRNRTADITYGDFTNVNGYDFSTYREIIVSEKNRLDIILNFKQYEFNKELSISFNIPKNYKAN